MSNINEIRDAAFELANLKSLMTSAPHNTYSPIYIGATSNVCGVMNLYSDYSSVLSVGSTGALGYEALLRGANRVDLFDINELQKLYYEYLQTGIKYLDYQTFIKHFTLLRNNGMKSEFKNLLSNEVYDKLVRYLPSEVEYVFTPLYDYFDSVDLILSGLFRSDYNVVLDYLKKYVSFYNEEYYYKLQRILRSDKCEINYKIADLLSVPNVFNKGYDLILLDNILQYYKDILGLQTPDLVNSFVKDKLLNLLNDAGTIQVNYGFELATDAFKVKLNIPFDDDSLNFLQMARLVQEQKNGINISLIEDYTDYYYQFIPGVETNPDFNSDNMVISLKKQ